jgi:anti-anti-sigma factor
MWSKGTHPGSSGDDDISIERRDAGGGTVVLVIKGDLDLASAPSLKWAMTDEVRAGAKQLVLDLAGVAFMDSTAIGVLVGIRRLLPDREAVALASPTPEVRKTLEITGLESTFRTFPTAAEAVAALTRSEPQGNDKASTG